jgi:hypothetical protein
MYERILCIYFLHLKVQKKIRVSGRTGIPFGILDGSNAGATKLTARALARHSIGDDDGHCDDGTESVVSALSVLSVRPKDETPKERSERKRALRQYRKVCDMTLSYTVWGERLVPSQLTSCLVVAGNEASLAPDLDSMVERRGISFPTRNDPSFLAFTLLTELLLLLKISMCCIVFFIIHEFYVIFTGKKNGTESKHPSI